MLSRLKIPFGLVVSSGSILILVTGILVLIGDPAASSTDHLNSDLSAATESLARTLETPESQQQTKGSPSIETSSGQSDHQDESNPPIRRSRSGRIYSQQAAFDSTGSQQQALMDNYAAAYGAAGSPTATSGGSSISETSSGQTISTQVANDPSSFASFGEPVSATSSVGSGRLGSPYYSASYHSGHPHHQAAASANHYSSMASHQYPSTNSGYGYKSSGASGLPLGYPSNGYDYYSYPGFPFSSRSSSSMLHQPLASHSSPFLSSGLGLMSSASSAMSHFTGGFGLSEIICGVIALAIGAAILGAPFFLIYLVLMGNFQGSGTLSLTNASASPPAGGAAGGAANGRRKRLAIFDQQDVSPTSNITGSTDDARIERRHQEFVALADAALNKLSPFINMKQVATSLGRLMDSIERFQQGPNRSDTNKLKAATQTIV